MTGLAYPAARVVAARVQEHFARHHAAARGLDAQALAPRPDPEAVEAIIAAAFWASLRREEGHVTKVSLAFVPPAEAGQPLCFARPLPLTPAALARLAPAVERPGIHLGVWRGAGGLQVWGTTRALPPLCFVLEVVEPGLLVVKQRRGKEASKFANIVVLKGDRIKEVDEAGAGLPDCPGLLAALLGFATPAARDNSAQALVPLAVSMRAHGRGGTLLVVPTGAQAWRESIVWPAPYAVTPPFTELADLMRLGEGERGGQLWREALTDAVEALAGLTAVDGAAVISDEYELLAFGTKIVRREGGATVERVAVTEPVVGAAARVVHPTELGGTRHLSAAQFAQDQPGALALVASQDGRFTAFAWSPCEDIVHAHRIESLLL
jgi:hypothetical protein